MPQNGKTYWDYVKKSAIWCIGNFMFGIIPILFLGLVYALSRGKFGFPDIDKLIHEGGLLFVCCAMTGGVLVDFLQSDFAWRGRQIFFIFLLPFAVMMLICLEYLFVVMNVINTDCFNISSVNSVLVGCFSFIYCISNKTMLLIKEDTQYE
jgi:hypothetical protein